MKLYLHRLIVAFAPLLASAPALAATVTPTDANKYVGQTVAVEGIASVYTSSSGVAFIDLSGAGRDSPFAGVIFKNDMRAFSSVSGYNGKNVDITGMVKEYRGKPEVILISPKQVQVK